MPSIDSEIPGACLQHVEPGGGLDGSRDVERSTAERLGQLQQDAVNLLGFLLLQRHDVVVDLDGAQRLEVHARTARGRSVHEARDVAPMFGLHDDDIAAVAFGDHLVLEILRGVLATQIGLERAAQLRLLAAQSIADSPQPRARIVHDIA